MALHILKCAFRRSKRTKVTWRQGWQVFVRIRLVFLSAFEIRNPVKILCRFFLLPDIRNKHCRLCMQRGHHHLEQRAKVYLIRQLDFYRRGKASEREVSYVFLTALFFSEAEKKEAEFMDFSKLFSMASVPDESINS